MIVNSSTTPRIPSSVESSLLKRDELKRLAQRAPVRLLLQTALEWTYVVLLMTAAVRFANVAVSFACILLIATRQHALLILMHEYSHYQFSRRRAWLNDLIGDVFTAFPFFITVHGYRRDHMQHHRHTWTPEDPNWVSGLSQERYQFPKTKVQVLGEILKHCVGGYTLRDLKGYTVQSGMAIDLPRSTYVSRLLFALVVCGVITWFHLWLVVLLYWILPLSTVLMAILYVRDVAEHFAMPSAGFQHSRTTRTSWLERLLVGQNGINYHAEHHLFPAVPFFRLEELHHLLMQNPEFRDKTVVTHGYFTGLMKEVTEETRAHSYQVTQQ